jgi:hypothetical protein
MSELEPADPQAGVASFDGTSLARLGPRQLTVPEAGGPTGIGQTGPWVMTGLRWVNDPTGAAPQRSNGFDVTLTGASAVRLDLAGMGIDPARAIAGRVTADHALDLRLDGGWSTVPPVTVDGAPTSTTLDADGVLHVALPAGSHAVAVG